MPVNTTIPLATPTPTTPAVERWGVYLRSLQTRGLTSGDVAVAAEQLWSSLRGSVASVTPPDASPSNDGGLLMSWDRNGLHMELEVLADCTYEWFFRQRSLDISEGGAEVSVDTISPELASRIRQVLS